MNPLRKFFPVNGPAEIYKPDLAILTPDIWKLEQFERQFLFVVGDQIERNLAQEASFVPIPKYPVCYSHESVTLWKKDLGVRSYPIVLPKSYRPTGFTRYPIEPAPVVGELWSILPNQFILLDKHKQNGIQFRRERVDVQFPYHEVGWSKERPLHKISRQYFVTKPAWMYIGIPEYWDTQIGGIFASAQIEITEHPVPRTRNNKYYRFE